MSENLINNESEIEHLNVESNQKENLKFYFIILSFSILFIVQFERIYSTFIYFVSRGIEIESFFAFVAKLPKFLIPIGVFLFWRRKKSGWILLNALTIDIILLGIGMIVLNYVIKVKNFFLMINLQNTIFTLVAFTIVLGVINSKSLKKRFKINNRTAIMTIFLSIIISSAIFAKTLSQFNHLF